MKKTDLPNPVRDDSPSPGDFDSGETVNTVRSGVCAVDFDGGRYCMDCANPQYVELCLDAERKIPCGGPVPEGSEVDCPGSTCGSCLRRIGAMVVAHYQGVCEPPYCDWSAECSTCGDYLFPGDPAAETNAGVVCRDCAKRGGVDVGAFCRPTREIVSD